MEAGEFDPILRDVTEKLAEGFRYLEDTVSPAIPKAADGRNQLLFETGSREQEAQERHYRRGQELRALYGPDNVWVGPRLSEVPPETGYKETETKGFYVRGEPTE